MNFSDATVDVLKNFATINPSLYFRKGSVLRTYSPQKTILAEAPITESLPQDFCIYELSKFLSALSLFKNPEVEFKENYLVIRNDNSKIKYVYADPSMITSPPEKTIKMPSEDVCVSVDQATFANVVKAVNILQLPEIAVVGDGEKVFLRAVNSKESSSNDYSVVVGETDRRFDVFFKVENIVKLMSNKDYSVTVSSKGIARFDGQDISYIVATEQHSTFE